MRWLGDLCFPAEMYLVYGKNKDKLAILEQNNWQIRQETDKQTEKWANGKAVLLKNRKTVTPVSD